MIFLTNIDLNKNELQNAVVQPLATPPVNPKYGQIYTDSSSSKIKWYDGSGWNTIGVIVESSATNGHIVVDGVDMAVYTLPIATATTAGGVKVGSGLAIDENGLLYTTGGGVADAVEWENVLHRPTAVSAFTNDAGYLTEHQDISGKVDKVDGKGLSTNDYTTAEKTKLAGIAAGAEANVNADWDATTGDAVILNKPTALSEFTNDENFIDSTVSNLANYYLKSETYTQAQINTMIGDIATIQIQVVASLPSTGKANIIYLVPKSPAASSNSYDEYIWVASSSTFEKVGDTEVDLSDYLKKSGDGSDVTVGFTSASSRAVPATGEALSVIIGKVVKYLNDLKSVAYSGSYADLTNKPTLVKTATMNISTSETTKSTTLTGTSVLGVMVRDSVTNEVVLCDVTINGMTVTVDVSATPTNALVATVSYL